MDLTHGGFFSFSEILDFWYLQTLFYTPTRQNCLKSVRKSRYDDLEGSVAQNKKKRQNVGSIRIEKYVQIARATFGFFTLVAQSFDLHLQSKDTDLEYEGNVQAKVFLSLSRWFLDRNSFFRSNNIHNDRF